MRTSDVVILVVLVAAALGAYAWRRWHAAQLRRGLAGARSKDREAAALLGQDGYRLVAVGARARLALRQDEREHVAEVRADLLVRGRGRLYVVEVRDGPAPARIGHRQMRRRLLEYFVAFRPHGILLVDVGKGRTRKVELAVRSRSAWATGAAPWLGAAGLGALLTYCWLQWVR